MHTALILAGGESRRFGRPKALVDFAGRPLIAHVADALASLADETIVSVADPDSAERIRSVLPHAIFVQDAQTGRGPIEGFRQGFGAARGEFLFVAPCDAPLLRSHLYRLLLDVLQDYDAAVPKFKVIDPVRGVYRRSRVREVLERAPSVPSPSALVDRLRAVFVGPDQIRAVDPEFSSFVDINTRGDLEKALRRRSFKND